MDICDCSLSPPRASLCPSLPFPVTPSALQAGDRQVWSFRRKGESNRAPHCCIALNSLFSLTPHLQAEPSVLPSTFQLNISTDLYHNSTVSRDLRALLQNPRANQHLYQLHQLPALAAAPVLPTPPGTLWGGFSARS